MTKSEKKNTKNQYVPEIIEGENNDGQAVWYFALINLDHFDAYQDACENQSVDIKQKDEGGLYLCMNGEKIGHIVDNGIGEPTEEQKEAFIEEYGVPVLESTQTDIIANDDALQAVDDEPESNEPGGSAAPRGFKP